MKILPKQCTRKTDETEIKNNNSLFLLLALSEGSQFFEEQISGHFPNIPKYFMFYWAFFGHVQ